MKLTYRLLLCLILLCLSPLAQAARPELTVMTYNLMQLPFLPGMDWDQAKRAKHTPAAIRSMSQAPDVIVFEEVFTNDAYARLGELADLYPYRTPVVGQVCRGGGWNSIVGNCSNSLFVIRGGVTVLSRWPIIEQHALIYRNSLAGSADHLSNKGAAYVRVRKQGYDYHIAGTHLQADQSSDGRREHAVRIAQLRELRQWLDGFGIARNEPLILAGDFNVEYSKGDDVIAMLDAAGADLNYPAIAGFGSYSSRRNWLARASAYSAGFSLDYDDTLDYVLWRPDHLSPAKPPAQVVVGLNSAERWYWYWMRGWWNLSDGRYWHDGYYSEISDHYPVMATFRYAR